MTTIDAHPADPPDSRPSSASATPSATPPATPSATPSASGTELTISIRRRPIPRKGHTKSRRGCFNCKRRKVKCQETRPECAHCTRIGLVCEYPDTRSPSSAVTSTSPESSLVTLSSPSAALQSTPTLFTSTDMRFFHHFLVTAYPPLPIRGDDIWRNVAPLSHSYDFLMHAMLGLGASHLNIYGGNYSSHALAHRVKAIRSLNKALCTPPKSTAEGDARFAAMFALAFQASCMPEGMTEFMAMVKGCHVIASTSMLAFHDSLFSTFTQQGYGDSVRRVIGTAPIDLDPDQEALIEGFLESLHALAPLCTSPLEVRFMASTERVVNVARISAAEAFAQFASHYALINHATKEEFAPFIDPHHYPAQLLLIHFILIEFAIGYIALGDFGRRFAYREKSCIAWMEQLAAALPDEYKKYAEWPMNYVRTELVG